MVEFGGWEMPLNYATSIFEEHLATRKSGGLFDVSHMGRLLICGRDALPFLQHVLTNNAAALEPGEAQYTLLPNERGGAIDDAYLYRLSQEQYLLVVNAANKEKDWQWLEENHSRFPGMVTEDYTDILAMLAFQGPRCKPVLETLLGGDGLGLPGPARNTAATVELLGTQMWIARTGYTGEPIGFEIFVPAERAVALWNCLLEAGAGEGIVAVGLGARDTLRLEAGLPLYGHELGLDGEAREIPILSLRLSRYCTSFAAAKGDYVGRGALVGQFQEVKARLEGYPDKPRECLAVPRATMPLAILGEGIARTGYEVYRGGILIGYVTSGTAVPYWRIEGRGVASRPGEQTDKRAIALAYLDVGVREGQEMEVSVRGRRVRAVAVDRHLGSEAAPYARPILVEDEKTEQSCLKQERR